MSGNGDGAEKAKQGKADSPIVIERNEEFERMWEDQMRKEREFAEEFLSGAYSDDAAKAAGREHGEYLERLVGHDGAETIYGELERLNVAILVHMGAKDQGNALRRVRADAHRALGNTGFTFENEFFRLAAYDWSDDEDEDGNPIHRPDFAVRGAGNCLDWYKWARRGDWASPGLVLAIEEAEERNIPLFAWFERVVDRCIESLMYSPDLETSETDPCPWRDFDASRTPGTAVFVDAPVHSDELRGLTFDHESEGYVGFVRIQEPPDLPEPPEDVTGRMQGVAEAVRDALERNRKDLLSNSMSVCSAVPDDLGYVVVGGIWFQRVFVRDASPFVRR